MEHLKNHWLKYYLVAGVLYAGYEVFGANPPQPFSPTTFAVNTLTWPFQIFAAAEVAVRG